MGAEAAESAGFPLSLPVVCVVGPTASGKSDLAQLLALELNGEVLSADSMQVYRGMDIGTGKVPADQRLVPHHGLDLVDPGEPYSAALYQDYARSCIRDVDERGKRCVLAGGTGFYVRAAIDAYDFPKGEQVGNEVRDHWNAYAEEHGAQALWDRLHERDPKSAELIAPANVKRVVRAFELLEDGGSYAEQREKLASLPQLVPAIFVGLAVDPDILRGRIDARVEAMLREGLLEEVQGLLDEGFREGVTAPQAIGYKEIVDYLDGKSNLKDAVERIKVATHRYAKKQRTWFRKDPRIHWLEADSGDVETLAQQALAIIEENGSGKNPRQGCEAHGT